MHEFVKRGDFVLVFLSEKWLIPRKYLTSEDGWDTCVFSLERRKEEAEKEAPGGQGQDEQLLVREWGYGRNRERSILETLANRVSGRRDALRRKRHGGESLSLPFREVSFLLGAQLYQEEFDKGNNLLIQKDLNTLRYNKCEGTWFCFCISLLTPASLALLFFHCYCFPHSCTKPFYIRPAVRKENNRHSLGRRKSQHIALPLKLVHCWATSFLWCWGLKLVPHLIHETQVLYPATAPSLSVGFPKTPKVPLLSTTMKNQGQLQWENRTNGSAQFTVKQQKQDLSDLPTDGETNKSKKKKASLSENVIFLKRVHGIVCCRDFRGGLESDWYLTSESITIFSQLPARKRSWFFTFIIPSPELPMHSSSSSPQSPLTSPSSSRFLSTTLPLGTDMVLRSWKKITGL